jgi:tRNA(Ile)-lysidine synthase
MNTFPAQLWSHCQRTRLFQPGAVIVAVSGGADSLALLHALHAIQDKLEISLHVAHFDHGIRPESADDAAFVAAFAESLGLPCTIGRGDVPAIAARDRVGIEAAARSARYAFLAETAGKVGAAQVVTAHHRDDQAETVLMHVLRGAGLAGLRGMLPRAPLPYSSQPGIMLIRPLLPFSRAQIEAYLAENNLTPRIDSTNADPSYLRNRLRLDIIPLLKTINPALDEALTQLATLAQDDYAALTALIPPYPYPRAQFAALPLSVQRLAIQQNPFRRENITFHDVENARHFIATGKTGDMITLSNGLTIALDFGHIRLNERIELHAPGIAPGTIIEMMSDQPIRLENGWQLLLLSQPTGDPDEIVLQIPQNALLLLRSRRNGDRFHPEGMGGHSQKLSDTLVNMKVPAVWRDHVPLLVTGERILLFVAPTPDGQRVRKAEPLDAAATVFFQIKFTG